MSLEYIPPTTYVSAISANLVTRAQEEILSPCPFASRIYHSVYFTYDDMRIHNELSSCDSLDEFWDRSHVFYLLVLESESTPIL